MIIFSYEQRELIKQKESQTGSPEVVAPTFKGAFWDVVLACDGLLADGRQLPLNWNDPCRREKEPSKPQEVNKHHTSWTTETLKMLQGPFPSYRCSQQLFEERLSRQTAERGDS